jgi:nucleoid DNA-binding protein
MNKVRFVEILARETGLTKKEATGFLDAFINIVASELETAGSFSLANFGSFKAKEFSTGRRIRFTAAKALREACTAGEDFATEAGPEIVDVAGNKNPDRKKSRRTWWDIYWI